MTYADMITLLLCFFAIFLSVSNPEKEKFKEARKEVIEKFGTPPTAASTESDMGNVVSVDDSSAINYKALPSMVGHFDDNKGSYQDKKGDRIVTLEMNSAAFFPSGTATLTDDGKKLLTDILKTINSDQYKDYVVTVEGHTDDNPINTPQFPSNWELSTSRASAVVRYFMQQGVSPTRLRASGYADTFPKVPNRDASGKPIPDNQAQNRRVIIKMERVDKSK